MSSIFAVIYLAVMVLIWSASGEGTGADTNPKAKSQNNSLAWFTDRLNINAMHDQLAKEHLVAQAQEKAA